MASLTSTDDVKLPWGRRLIISAVVVILKACRWINLSRGDKSRIILSLLESFLGRLNRLAANFTFLAGMMTPAEDIFSMKPLTVGESGMVTCGRLRGFESQVQPKPFLAMDWDQVEKPHLFQKRRRRPPTFVKSMGSSSMPSFPSEGGFGISS